MTTSSPEGRQALDATGLKAAHRVMFERVAYGDEISPRDMEAVIGAYLSALPDPVAAAPVGVKALEWEEEDHNWWGAQPLHRFCYEVRVTDRGDTRVRSPEDGGWTSFDGDLDAAKAAAQSDFEARIRSLIAPAKPAVELVEAMWLRKHAALVRELGSSMSPGALAATMDRRAAALQQRLAEADTLLTDRMTRANPKRPKEWYPLALRFVRATTPAYDMDMPSFERFVGAVEAIAALSSECPHNCDEGGICLAEHAGYPKSCPRAALQAPAQTEVEK